MKKHTSTEKNPPSFGNSPFKALKQFKPAADRAPVEKKKAPSETASNEDDSELFLRAVAGARAISRGETAGGKNPEKTAPPAPVEDDHQSDKQLFLNAMLKMGARLKESRNESEDDQARPQSASSRMKQLKRGAIVIKEELDLHGYLKEEAVARLAQFIAGARQRGRKAVLVITGKGINSPEGPVLQGAVAAWLRDKGRGVVAEFAPAPRDKGGSGAFVVFLKSK